MKKLALINQRFIKAAQNNQIDKLKNLLSQGADIHTDNDFVLRYSAGYGHLETVKLLFAQGANIHANDDEALRESAYYGHLEIVKFLLEHGANIHANDDEALKNSTLNKHYDVWQALSAFIQEKRLLVAASNSIQELSSVESAPKTKRPSITITKRSKI